MSTTRRQTIQGLAALPLAALPITLATHAAAAVRTPTATEGPFYPTTAMRFDDTDSDLVKIKGAVENAGGEVVMLKGRVFDGAGNPAQGARVEIWQCDINGRYLHTGERGTAPRDPAFQGFGQAVTDADGSYAFRTIKPVPYPGRTPHIHVKVIHQEGELTTQFYILDHPQNQKDWLYQRLSQSQQRAVSMVFDVSAAGPEARVDIHL